MQMLQHDATPKPNSILLTVWGAMGVLTCGRRF